MSSNSLALRPWGSTPASVPKPMMTPFFSALRNILPELAMARRALAAMAGGK